MNILSQLICKLKGGHYTIIKTTDTTIQLECLKCNYKSKGWSVATRRIRGEQCHQFQVNKLNRMRSES